MIYKRNILILFSIVLLLATGKIHPQAGQLDPSFGQGGITTTAINSNSNAYIASTAIQTDGKIITGGSVVIGQDAFALARYNENGELDNTFGTNGIVIKTIGSSSDYISSIVIQSDEKIVAIGTTYNGTDYDFAVARFNQDGSLDKTFGVNGIVTTQIGTIDNEANAGGIQNDGKILAAGYSDSAGTSVFTIARYNTNGDLDNTFGINGIVTTSVGIGSSLINSLAIQNDGSIVVTGYSVDSSGTRVNFALARYNSNGGLDNSFGNNGIVYTTIRSNYDYPNAVKIQNDGKIVAAGYSLDSIGTQDFAIVRYNQNGSLDTSFDNDGIVIISNSISNDEANSIAFQNDGKILVGGFRLTTLAEFFLLVRLNQDGSIDNRFGPSGIKSVSLSSEGNEAFSLVIQADGKIIQSGYKVSGGDNYFATVRYDTTGEVDYYFGLYGVVTTAVGILNDEAFSSIIQTDGKIVAAGYSYNGNDNDFALTRYNSNGILDKTFGMNGIVTTSVDSTVDGIFSLAEQNDGKIVAAGFSNNGTDDDFALVRYNVDGSFDNTFGTSGIVVTPISDTDNRARFLVIQTDGKLIAAGFSNNDINDDFALARYNTDGSLDNTFGTNGIVTTPIGTSDDIATSAALQNDGKIILAGYTGNGSNDDFALVRYKEDGNLDSTFGSNGIVTTHVGFGEDKARSVLLQNDGKIIAAGYSGNGSNFDFALVRYIEDGTLDTTFGTKGKVTTSIGTDGDLAYASVLQSDGKILLAGTSKIGSYNDIALVRYKSDGTIDTTFGTNGKVITQIGISLSYGYSIALQDDGNIIVSGYSTDGDNYSVFTVARYLNDVAMPVELTSFTANENDRGVVLDWKTATEINNYGFEIEKSPSPTPSQREGASNPNKINWNKIGFVNGHGNSTSTKQYSFIDKSLQQGNVKYRLKQIDFNGSFEYSSEVEVSVSALTKFELYQNYPNPFNPATKIKFSVSSSPQTPLLTKEGGRGEAMTLKVYDILGREVATLVNEKKEPGNYEVTFDGSKLSSGVYFYQLKSGQFVQTKKLLLIK